MFFYTTLLIVDLKNYIYNKDNKNNLLFNGYIRAILVFFIILYSGNYSFSQNNDSLTINEKRTENDSSPSVKGSISKSKYSIFKSNRPKANISSMSEDSISKPKKSIFRSVRRKAKNKHESSLVNDSISKSKNLISDSIKEKTDNNNLSQLAKDSTSKSKKLVSKALQEKAGNSPISSIVKDSASKYRNLNSQSLKEKMNNSRASILGSDSISKVKNLMSDSIYLKPLKKFKAELKKKTSQYHGSISNQLDYGTVPYYFPGLSSPTGALKSQGDIKLTVKELPFIFNYFYSYPNALFGLQNYFTFKFDQESYQQNLQKKMVEKKSMYSQKLDELQKQKQLCEQKLAYCEMMKDYQPPAIDASQNATLPNTELKPNKFDPAITGLEKKQGLSLPKRDSLNYKDSFNDTLSENTHVPDKGSAFSNKLKKYSSLSGDTSSRKIVFPKIKHKSDSLNYSNGDTSKTSAPDLLRTDSLTTKLSTNDSVSTDSRIVKKDKAVFFKKLKKYKVPTMDSLPTKISFPKLTHKSDSLQSSTTDTVKISSLDGPIKDSIYQKQNLQDSLSGASKGTKKRTGFFKRLKNNQSLPIDTSSRKIIFPKISHKSDSLNFASTDTSKVLVHMNNLDSLNLDTRDTVGGKVKTTAEKLAFLKKLKNKQTLPIDTSKKNVVPTFQNTPDTSSTESNGLQSKLSKADSLKQKENLYIDSLLTHFNASENRQKLQEYKEGVEMYDKQILEYQQAIKLLDYSQAEYPQNPYLTKAQNILKNVKQFEIGLCYPNYSTFLINNLTLKGINVAYQTKNYFANFTYGKTVNNLLVNRTNNSIINTFNNYSNFFNFNNTNDSRKVLAGKIGLGDFSKSYIGFGALYGMGNQSYFQQTTAQERNIVYELDGKINFKGYMFYASWAKSFITQPTDNENPDVLDKSRNNGLQLRFSGVIPYLKTKFSLGYRMVDPFFKSYGVGFMRNDNIRYEAKLDQKITSKIKVGLNFRYDQDNILKRYGFQSNLYLISLSSKFKFLKKRIDLQLIYTPIIQKIENLSTKRMTKNISDMKNVIISFTPKVKKNIYTFTAIYSQYTLYDSISLRNMENATLNISSIFRNTLRISLNSAYFNSNVRDSISSPKTIINSVETGITIKKKVTPSLSLKHSYNVLNDNHQFGAGLNINFPLLKGIFVDVHAEKLILGDFYNSLDLVNLEKFPYYCYIKLNLKF